MADPLPDFAALIGSRICHDLISPLGAIGNGVELLEMSSAGASPEMALISESVASANARIRFFRIAFGAAGSGGSVAAAEIRSILAAMTHAWIRAQHSMAELLAMACNLGKEGLACPPIGQRLAAVARSRRPRTCMPNDREHA